MHVNRLYVHHFPSRRKLVWLTFSFYRLWITNWKNVCMHFYLFLWKAVTAALRPGQPLSSSVPSSYGLLPQKSFLISYRQTVLWRLKEAVSSKGGKIKASLSNFGKSGNEQICSALKCIRSFHKWYFTINSWVFYGCICYCVGIWHWLRCSRIWDICNTVAGCPEKNWKNVKVCVAQKLCKGEVYEVLLHVGLFAVIWPERKQKVDVCSFPMKRTFLSHRNL